MKVTGLITEYNPFHNGHKYHIEETRRLTGADYIIAVMSGDFVQRGTPAMIDKYSRARMALLNGVDLIFELPVCYAAGSAEYFAHGAVSLLHGLGIVDSLCFGSEEGDISLLAKAAKLLIDANDSFSDDIRVFLREGLSYPAARQKALLRDLDMQHASDEEALHRTFTEPNNILGIEYLKALNTFSSDITPVTIKRRAAHYHDKRLYENTPSKSAGNRTADRSESYAELYESSALAGISSATAIRRAVLDNSPEAGCPSLSSIKQSVPHNVYQMLNDLYQKTFPITEETFSSIIKYKLLSEDCSTLACYADISKDLADRMKNLSDYNMSISALADSLKTRNITRTRINRALLHLLLGIRSEDLAEYSSNGYCAYARVLGFRKEASHLLRKIESVGQIPVITRVSKAREQLNATGQKMLSMDLFATHLYNQAVYEQYKTMLENEYKHGLVLV